MINICIIPFFNEEKRIDLEYFNNIFSTNLNISFLLINDGSTDNTLQCLIDNFTLYPNVIINNNKINIGKANTIKKGFHISQNFNCKYIGFFDADFATPFSEFIRLLKIAQDQNMDVVFGSRIMLYGSDIIRNPYRHYLSRIILTFLNYYFNLKIYDTQCGCKIYKKTVIENITKEVFVSKWLFDIEIFLILKKSFSKLNILEVPLLKWHEIPGSKIKAKDIFLIPFDLFKIILKYKN